ncbi:MAG: TetR/AcrR family transcriptional regulator [Acidimicrobiia bacterium]|nr:TetR/AcrR family transcriptional regulator [Acidimicrobiia bacterium]
MGDVGWVHKPQQARSQETLDRFLDAGLALLAERPFDDVSVADITERAGRTVGSFYARFDDKYALLYLLVARMDSRVRDLVHAFCDPARWDGQPVGAFVGESVRLNLQAYRSSAALFRAALCAATTDERFATQRMDLLSYCATQHKTFLRTRADELSVPDVSRAADRSFEFMTSALDHHLLFGRFTETSPEGDLDLVADIAEQCARILGIDESTVHHSNA